MSSTPSHAYLFEAKGIQRWILEGGRLRHIASASNVLADCCRSDGQDLLEPVLARAGFAQPPHFSRRAGGAFMLHYANPDEAAFRRFRALWRLTFMQIAPGLEFQESFGRGADALAAWDNAYRSPERPSAGRENGVASLLPLGHSLCEFAPRTGRPALSPSRDAEDPMDIATRAKHAAARPSGGVDWQDTIGSRFLSKQLAAQALWPDVMERGPDDPRDAVVFPIEAEPKWIAILHADISALGEFYAGARKHAAGRLDHMPKVAQAIEQAVADAARKAGGDILWPNAKPHGDKRIIPARPILLGGDDLTILLRGDVALPFARTFLATLETKSLELLRGSGGELPLTAAAGIAFGKPKQPFFRLLALAEELCALAKRRSKQVATGKRPPSVLAFHRVTESALAASADDLFERLTIGDYRLVAQPYVAGDIAAPGLLRFEHLEALKRALADPDLKSGRLREIRSMFQQEQTELAVQEWGRWDRMAERRARNARDGFVIALRNAIGGEPEHHGFLRKQEGALITPVFDALEWHAISGAELDQ